jgi:hypothetical protein
MVDTMLSDFYFNVKLVANTVEQLDTLYQILVNSLPRRGYIKWAKDNQLMFSSNLFVQYISYADVSFLAEGILEKVYRFCIPDVSEIDPDIIASAIPKISSITLEKDNEEIINI